MFKVVQQTSDANSSNFGAFNRQTSQSRRRSCEHARKVVVEFAVVQIKLHNLGEIPGNYG